MVAGFSVEMTSQQFMSKLLEYSSSNLLPQVDYLMSAGEQGSVLLQL